MGRALLLIVSGFVIILGVERLNMDHQQNVMLQRNSNYGSLQQSRNIASSMIDVGISYLNNDITWRSGDQENHILGGSGNVSVTDPSSDPSLGPYDLRLDAKGTYNGVSSNIEAILRRTSFSKYAYFTNYEPLIYFVSKDTVKGPLHTNGTLHIMGDPVFDGEVTSPNSWMGTGTPQFNNGYNFNSNTIQLPTDMTGLEAMSATGGLSFNNDLNIQFKNNGKVDISQFDGTSWSSPQTYDLSGYNGVITSYGNITVQGTLKGQVTVYSEKNINISGDMTYADDPQKDPSSTDMLGLIAQNDIVVEDNAEKAHGNSDLNIQAAMMALHSFRVQDYNKGTMRGKLNLLGGIVQDTRGPVGTVNNQGTMVTGYSKNYDYDQRLLNSWPPGYPLQDSYSIISWKE
ncbi:MAG TPA: DUF4900 domain-containing protein [Balneolales bacterium]|nr:DUF4900 domain-containing protein [Balneolales bacterium]